MRTSRPLPPRRRRGSAWPPCWRRSPGAARWTGIAAKRASCTAACAVRATIRFSRSGRTDDMREATVNFVEAVPVDGQTESLVLATTLPVQTRTQARAVVRLYAQRWAIESGFEMMPAWGQDRFMVRTWMAIDRLLSVLAVAYAL